MRNCSPHVYSEPTRTLRQRQRQLFVLLGCAFADRKMDNSTEHCWKEERVGGHHAHPYPSIRTLTQEKHHEFEASLGYRMRACFKKITHPRLLRKCMRLGHGCTCLPFQCCEAGAGRSVSSRPPGRHSKTQKTRTKSP